MPIASAPNAPWVEVWLSPHTTVMPGWVSPELRADDVHDALLDVAHRVQPDAELLAVAAQCLHLGPRDRVGDRLVDVDRRHVVVLGGDRQIGPVHRPAGQPQSVEGLRAGHLVDEVQVDVDQVRLPRGTLAGAGDDDVVAPHLLGEGAGLVRDDHLDYLTIWDASISL